MISLPRSANMDCPTRGGVGIIVENEMIELKVTGMTCGHCEAAVERALSRLPGVERVMKVSRDDERVIVEGNADVAALIAVIEEEGYTAETVA